MTSSTAPTIRAGYLIITTMALLSCSPVAPGRFAPPASVALGFSAGPGSDWMDPASPSEGGRIFVDVGAQGWQLHVVSEHGQQKRLRRRIDVSPLRGKRVLASAETELHPRESMAFAAMVMSVERASGRKDAWDSSTSQQVTDPAVQTLQVALDVPQDATSLDVELDVRGDADARFAPPRLWTTTMPDRPELPLSREMVNALRALTQLVGYLRFFHPSDQVATLAWPVFEADAVHRLLAARGQRELQDVLRAIVAAVAPTARLYEEGHRPPASPPLQASGTKLTRWVRIGSGNDGDPYSAFRTGIAEPADVGLMLLKTTPSLGCKHATVRLAAKTEQGAPIYHLHLFPLRGSGVPTSTSRVVPGSGSIDGKIPPGATEIMYGVQVGGEGIIDLSEVELSCDGRVLAAFSSSDDPEVFGAAPHLYSVTKNPDCAGCLTISRAPEQAYQPRDEIDVDIGLGLRLRMPLAVWTDGKRTYPEVPAAPPLHVFPPGDRASRIASAIDTWSTLRWFYPYFAELHVDWDHPLNSVLDASAGATSADDLLVALRTMVAGLRDDHATVYRPGYDNGILPLVFRQLDSKLYVVHGIATYKDLLPKGSVLEALDGVPTHVLLTQQEPTISAATSSWRNAYLPFVLGDGPMGTMVSVRARTPDGALVTIRIPRLARSKYLLQKREDRPATGTEISPGVYYLDSANLDNASWNALLPKLATSRGVVCDLREGASPAAFQVLAHFIDHEIKSPYWDKPIASTTETTYQRSQSSIFPSLPRLSSKLVFVVNGRTASSPETILQYARGAGIGYVIGEPTGGTNGDVASFDTLGGLRIRFTGLRTLNQDGSPFHGTGFAPDLIVHPTVAGLRAGRDELLDAAIAYLATP